MVRRDPFPRRTVGSRQLCNSGDAAPQFFLPHKTQPNETGEREGAACLRFIFVVFSRAIFVCRALFVFVRVALGRHVFVGGVPGLGLFVFAVVVDIDENTGDQGDRDDAVDTDRDRDQPPRRRDRRQVAETDGRHQHKGVPEPVAERLDPRLEQRQKDRRPDHRDHKTGEDLRRVGLDDDPPEQTPGHHVLQVRVDPGDALHQKQQSVDHDLRLDRTADLADQFREQGKVDDDHKRAAYDRARIAAVPFDRGDVFGDHRGGADRHKDHRQIRRPFAENDEQNRENETDRRVGEIPLPSGFFLGFETPVQHQRRVQKHQPEEIVRQHLRDLLRDRDEQDARNDQKQRVDAGRPGDRVHGFGVFLLSRHGSFPFQIAFRGRIFTSLPRRRNCCTD